MRPTDIAHQIAECLGVPVSTVELHSRNLREAGIRPKSPRGRGAGTLTFKDTANLIIAVVASRNVKDSAAMVERYAPMPAREVPLSGDDPWGQTFGEALTELLESVHADRERFSGVDGDTITVALFGPDPKATIELHLKENEEPLILKYEGRLAKGESYYTGDLTYISQFTQITLGFVGQAIAGDSAA